MVVPIKVIQERRGGESVDIHPQTSIEAVIGLDEILDTTEDQILEINNKKEDKSNKVSAFQETPDNNHYPTEKLVYDSLYTYHKHNITPIAVPPGFEIKSFVEFGNGITNTIQIVFDKVDSLSTNFKIGQTDYKPLADTNTSVRSTYGGEVGGYILQDGSIWIWSSYGQPLTGVLGGVQATYVVKR